MGKNEHYYTSSPTSDYEKHTVSYSIGNRSYSFASASGVFSKHDVDFGSNLLIHTVVDDAQSCSSLLDIGCGYGVIGIVLSSVLNAKATLCDVNQRALELARTNAKSYKATVIESDGLSNITGTYDTIITNPPIRAGKETYYKWFDQAPEYLNDNGSFYCVIQKKQGAPSAKKYLAQVFGNCEIIAKDKGYFILKSTK